MIDQTGIIYIQGSRYFTASLPFAEDLGWFGEIFLSHGILIYLAIVIALVTSFVLNKTKVGLHLRAVGENPATADAAGINVSAYRYAATCIGCGISGLGGLSFIMDYLNGNWEYCIDAIGWLAIALVIFTVWKPNLAIIGSIIFGGLYIASTYIQGFNMEAKEIFKMLPYIVTVIVLLFTSIRNKKKNQPPQSLGLNYFREER
jgi:simple sugar transport system permease protein